MNSAFLFSEGNFNRLTESSAYYNGMLWRQIKVSLELMNRYNTSNHQILMLAKHNMGKNKNLFSNNNSIY